MKLKDLFENEEQHPGFLTDHEKIKRWLTENQIKNWLLHPNGSVDITGDLEISYSSDTHIPVKFNSCHSLVVRHTKLKSLIGCPRKVTMGCSIFNNDDLTSLKGGPKHVGQTVWLYRNPKLTSMDYAPIFVGMDIVVDTDVTIEDFPLTVLKGDIVIIK